MKTNGRSNRGVLESRMELWRNRFRDFSLSRDTVLQFCSKLGVTPATFYYWRKKLADADEGPAGAIRSVADNRKAASRQSRQVSTAATTSGSFIPVRITRTPAGSGEVVIRLPSGAQVQIPAGASEVIATVIAQVCELRTAATSEVA